MAEKCLLFRRLILIQGLGCFKSLLAEGLRIQDLPLLVLKEKA